MKYFYSLLVLLMICAFSSCDKEEEPIYYPIYGPDLTPITSKDTIGTVSYTHLTLPTIA